MLAAAAALAAAGCSTGTSSGTELPDEARALPTTPAATNPAEGEEPVIAPEVVERQFAAALTDARPTDVDDVVPPDGGIDCPDGVAARATATTACVYTTPDGATRRVTATVTSVADDGTARLSFDVEALVTAAPSTGSGARPLTRR